MRVPPGTKTIRTEDGGSMQAHGSEQEGESGEKREWKGTQKERRALLRQKPLNRNGQKGQNAAITGEADCR